MFLLFPEPKWERYSGSAYLFAIDASREVDTTRAAANVICRSMGATLVAINSEEELTFLQVEGIPLSVSVSVCLWLCLSVSAYRGVHRSRVIAVNVSKDTVRRFNSCIWVCNRIQPVCPDSLVSFKMRSTYKTTHS